MKEDARYWQRHARRYDRFTLLLSRRFPEMARQVAEDLRGRGRVLELAAGTGLVTVELARTVGALVATDRSAEMLEVLRGRLGSASLEVQARVADATAIDEADGAFDAVVAANLLHLLPDPALMLREAQRVLRPGGLLAVPTFAHGFDRTARTVSRVLGLTGFPIVTRFGEGQVARLVEASGFRVLRSRIYPGLLPLDYVLAERIGE
jgi:phosphatidylethanolamine/phosphatidyl-N-methylethanolamine N-methyltransferase